MPPDSAGDHIASVRSAYDRWSSHYDNDSNRTRDLDAQILRTHGPSVRGRAVLELGCGTGKNTEWLAGNCRLVTALDVSPGMLELARERVPAQHVSFHEHDITTPWPVEDQTIDLVVGNLVLEHVRDLRTVFAECARVLRRGGKVFLSELHPMRQLLGSQARYVDPQDGETVLVPAVRHSLSEYVNSAVEGGFTVRRVGEWNAEEDTADTPPRLLTLYLIRAA